MEKHAVVKQTQDGTSNNGQLWRRVNSRQAHVNNTQAIRSIDSIRGTASANTAHDFKPAHCTTLTATCCVQGITANQHQNTDNAKTTPAPKVLKAPTTPKHLDSSLRQPQHQHIGIDTMVNTSSTHSTSSSRIPSSASSASNTSKSSISKGPATTEHSSTSSTISRKTHHWHRNHRHRHTHAQHLQGHKRLQQQYRRMTCSPCVAVRASGDKEL